MNPEVKKILGEQYQKLPPDVKAAISSVDLRGRIAYIADKNGLMVDESGVLEDEIVLVLFGLEHPNDFTANIQRHVGVERARAEAIVNDADEEIFKPIKASLMSIHEKREGEIEQAPTPPGQRATETRQQATRFIERKLSEPTASAAGEAAQQPTTLPSPDPYREAVE